MEKIKVMTIGDMPLSPSGVGTQSKIIIEALLQSGKFTAFSLGGAIKHQKYQPIRTEEYGDDWTLLPVDHFGNPDIIRTVIRNERPDILWFMTDPRFYEWLWAMEDEIRPLIPMVYYHVWDNYPYPKYNSIFYDSTDEIVTISKVTDDIVKNVSPNVGREYLPHAINPDIFKPFSENEILDLRKKNFPQWDGEEKFLLFWNNRNARRKQSGTLIWWYKEFLDIVGHDKCCLLMHTDPNDVNGPDLQAIISELGLVNGEVLFSKDKIHPEGLAQMYNTADVTVNISDAEGFGLSTLESLNCGTPIVVCMTGGLKEQVTDGENWFGVGIEPASQVIVGSQQVPFIYEDRLNKQDFIDALLKMYNMSREERRKVGLAGQAHAHKNYNYEEFKNKWVELMLKIYEKHGSWRERKNHKAWEFKEVA
tara:strand:+ start:673 stop:1935 length:1263 start_codon:yes stop_codon:yes gene_type:complete